ncbi:hypothetical protein VNO77_19999 [Canavalia gladiata]|uniref:Uncharacterized protein n=1 Tax=Canavalia gladiata TaxID=3824 RepID=A0AAN9LTN6_CANGL
MLGAKKFYWLHHKIYKCNLDNVIHQEEAFAHSSSSSEMLIDNHYSRSNPLFSFGKNNVFCGKERLSLLCIGLTYNGSSKVIMGKRSRPINQLHHCSSFSLMTYFSLMNSSNFQNLRTMLPSSCYHAEAVRA